MKNIKNNVIVGFPRIQCNDDKDHSFFTIDTITKYRETESEIRFTSSFTYPVKDVNRMVIMFNTYSDIGDLENPNIDATKQSSCNRMYDVKLKNVICNLNSNLVGQFEYIFTKESDMYDYCYIQV